jgi:tetratricopeptide (TPR) repeat protein
MAGRVRDLEPDEERFVKEFGARLAGVRAGCPPPEMLLAARAGVLPEESGAGVAAHLASCPACRALSEDLADDELSKLTARERDRIRARVLAAAGVRSAARWRWFWRPVPVAAMVILAVAAGAWIWLSRPARPPARIEVAAERSVPRLPAVLRLEKPPVKLPAAAALIWRGQGAPAQQEFLKEFGAALGPYRAGDYREAASRLEALSKKYPKAAEPHFYLGVCRLFLACNEEAVTALEQAKRLAEGALQQDAAWYLGIACLRAGRARQGTSELRGLCAGAGEYQARACAVVEELGR